MDFFRAKCKENNLRMTTQRMAVYEEVVGSEDHPNADAIFRKIQRKYPTISFDTVNRTLQTFSEIGILNVVEGHGDPKRYDPNVDSHHHFKCVRCNRIVDFYDDSYDRLKFPKQFQKGFVVLGRKVVLEGICDRCG